MTYYELKDYISILTNDSVLTSLLYEYSFIQNSDYSEADTYNYEIMFNLAEYYDTHNVYIQENTVKYLMDISIDTNYVLARGIYSIFKTDTMPTLVLSQIYYTLKYSSVNFFFKKNYKKFLPDFDSYQIDQTQKTSLLQTAFMQEFDKFSSIIGRVANIGDIDTIPASYLTYIGQLVGYTGFTGSGSIYGDSNNGALLDDNAFRYLIKNIIDIYNMKGTSYSFELFFYFLGFNTVITEYWFDRRFYHSNYTTNPYTGETDKTKFGYYLTPYDPTKTTYSFTSEVVSDNSGSNTLLDFNSLVDTTAAVHYPVSDILGYKISFGTSKYSGKVFTYFKTNIVGYNVISIDTEYRSTSVSSTNEIDIIKSYIELLTPINIYKIVKFSAAPETDNGTAYLTPAEVFGFTSTDMTADKFTVLFPSTSTSQVRSVEATLSSSNLPMTLLGWGSNQVLAAASGGIGDYMVVGQNGYYSNGMSTPQWTAKTISGWGTYDINSIAKSGGVYYVAGKNGQFAKTTDYGTSWGTVSTNLLSNGYQINAMTITTGPSIIIVAGTNGYYNYSSNAGTTWAGASAINGWAGNTINAMASNGTTVIAVGTNGMFSVSNNSGVSWSIATPMNGWGSTGIVEDILSIDYASTLSAGPSGFIAVGSSGSFSYSLDGVLWTPANTITNWGKIAARCVKYNASGYNFTVVGDYGRVAQTNNATTWTTSVISSWAGIKIAAIGIDPSFSYNMMAFGSIIADTGMDYMLVAAESGISTSETFNTTFGSLKLNIKNLGTLNARNNNNMYIQDGYAPLAVQYITLVDGSNLTQIQLLNPFNGSGQINLKKNSLGQLSGNTIELRDLTNSAQNGIYTIVGATISGIYLLIEIPQITVGVDQSGVAGMAYINAENTKLSRTFLDSTMSDRVMNYLVKRSSFTWKTSTQILGTNAIYSMATDDKGIWVVAGENGYYNVSTNNGRTWGTSTQLSGWGTNIVRGIATDGNGRWIAVGDNGYSSISSTNGTTWSAGSSTFLGFAGNSIYTITTDKKGTWVAGGNNGYKNISTNNGNTWGTAASLSGWGASVIYSIANDGNNTWIAVGGLSKYSISTDGGITWSSGVAMSGWSSGNIYTIATDKKGTWVVSGVTGYGSYSIDAGVTWSAPITNVLPASTVYSLTTDANGIWFAGGMSGYYNTIRTISAAILSGGAAYTQADVGKLVTIKKLSMDATALITQVNGGSGTGAVTGISLWSSGSGYTAGTATTFGPTVGSGLTLTITVGLSVGTAAATALSTNTIRAIVANSGSKWMIGGDTGYYNMTI